MHQSVAVGLSLVMLVLWSHDVASFPKQVLHCHPIHGFELRKFDVYISSSRVSQPNICEISWLGSGENFRSCIPSPDFWFTAAFLVHLWKRTNSRSYRNGICFIFISLHVLGVVSCFFVKHFSNITGRFSLVTAWRRTPQAVAPSAALRFAPPVPQLQLAKQRCWGRQQGYQNPDQIKSKSEKKQCRQEMMWELKILHW